MPQLYFMCNAFFFIFWTKRTAYFFLILQKISLFNFVKTYFKNLSSNKKFPRNNQNRRDVSLFCNCVGGRFAILGKFSTVWWENGWWIDLFYKTAICVVFLPFIVSPWTNWRFPHPLLRREFVAVYWHTRLFRSNKQICWSDSTEAFEHWRTLACYLNTFFIKIAAIIKVTLISWLTISMQQEFEPNICLQRKVLSNLWCLQKNGIGDWPGF